MADPTTPPAPARQRRRRHDSIAAEAEFRKRLEELGATLLEETWLGNGRPHRVRCAAGHECSAYPHAVRRGQGICRTCAGNDPRAAEAAFRANLEHAGATLLEPTWLGVDRPHRARCAAGHECTPYPSAVRRGQGICRTCARKDPAAAEAAFRRRLEELGATLLEPRWLGNKRPHRVRCAAGHEVTPRPNNVQQGDGICRTCAGLDPNEAEAAFRARLAAAGATLLEPRWLGVDKPHRVRCANGHEAAPTPSNVRRGQGICQACSYTWDIFYVVRDPQRGIIKFGVTSNDPRVRLAAHARNGFTEVLRLHTNVSDGIALERSATLALQAAGHQPVQGREYYPGDAQDLILELVDGLLTSQPEEEGQLSLW